MEGLVIGGGTLVDVDNHGGFPSSTEEGLEELCEFALSERNVADPRPAQQVYKGLGNT